MDYDSDDYAWKIADLITKKEYAKAKPGRYYVVAVSVISSALLWLGAMHFGIIWACVLYYLIMLPACFLVYKAGIRLYGFLDGDLRSTSEYMHYRKSGRNFFLAMLLSVVGIICLVNKADLVYWISMAVSSLIMIFVALDVYLKTSIEFGPGNGRYTLRLKITIRGKYSDAELAQLYNTLNK